MDFVLSKLLWMVARPTNLLLLSLAVSCALALDIRRRWAALLAFALTCLMLVLGALPVGLWLLRPLEERFARVDPPPAVTGIIVLGGAQAASITQARGVLALTDAAARMVEGAALARRFPNATLVFAGGSGSLDPGAAKESVVNEVFVELEGLDRRRVLMEAQSRNTYENAMRTRELVQPSPGQTWLLVTSAFHMPRSIGIFRRIGWDVVPFPVDYKTTGASELSADLDMSGNLAQIDRAAREWVGLVAYWLMDRTSALFPAPAS